MISGLQIGGASPLAPTTALTTTSSRSTRAHTSILILYYPCHRNELQCEA